MTWSGLYSDLFSDMNARVSASILTDETLFITLAIPADMRFSMSLFYDAKGRDILCNVSQTKTGRMHRVSIGDIPAL